MSDDHLTPFKLVVSKGPSGAGSKLLYEGREIPMVKAVSVENIVCVDDMNRSRIVIDIYGTTEVEQAK
jgi:hypothetical protein